VSQIFRAIYRGPNIVELIARYGIDIVELAIERECQFTVDELTGSTVEKYIQEFNDMKGGNENDN
jgi:hypothetical protein